MPEINMHVNAELIQELMIKKVQVFYAYWNNFNQYCG